MDKSILNPCTRCGKQRIEKKTWKEKVQNLTGSVIVIITETICPDVECQRIVEKNLDIQTKKREEITKNRLQRHSLKR